MPYALIFASIVAIAGCVSLFGAGYIYGKTQAKDDLEETVNTLEKDFIATTAAEAFYDAIAKIIMRELGKANPGGGQVAQKMLIQQYLAECTIAKFPGN